MLAFLAPGTSTCAQEARSKKESSDDKTSRQLPKKTGDKIVVRFVIFLADKTSPQDARCFVFNVRDTVLISLSFCTGFIKTAPTPHFAASLKRSGF